MSFQLNTKRKRKRKGAWTAEPWMQTELFN